MVAKSKNNDHPQSRFWFRLCDTRYSVEWKMMNKFDLEFNLPHHDSMRDLNGNFLSHAKKNQYAFYTLTATYYLTFYLSFRNEIKNNKANLIVLTNPSAPSCLDKFYISWTCLPFAQWNKGIRIAWRTDALSGTPRTNYLPFDSTRGDRKMYGRACECECMNVTI